MNGDHAQERPERTFSLDMKRCLHRSCNGELVERSYYERNNWVTVEYECSACGTAFTVKVEV